jgi:6-phosphogluconolactonase (cycloisomerase 2 family)
LGKAMLAFYPEQGQKYPISGIDFERQGWFPVSFKSRKQRHCCFGNRFQNGTLSPVQNIPSGGKTPGNFAIDSTGLWLFVANQASTASRCSGSRATQGT